MVEMYEYLADNPKIIVGGFIKSGNGGALDDCRRVTQIGKVKLSA